MPRIDKEKIEKFRKGEIKFTQIFDFHPNQIAALLLSGHNFLMQGRLDDAKSIFEGLAVIDPNNPYLHTVLGAIHQQQLKEDLAILNYSRAIELFPQDINALTNRGEIYLKQGKFLEAAEDFKTAIALDQNHPSANRARMLSALTAKKLAEMQA